MLVSIAIIFILFFSGVSMGSGEGRGKHVAYVAIGVRNLHIDFVGR